MAFKVVLISNFYTKTVDDQLLNQEIYADWEDAELVADRYNKEVNNAWGEYFAVVKPNDYELHKFVP